MLKLNFETITPLHIANGNNLTNGLDYIIEDGFLAKLKLSKATKLFADNGVFNFTRNYTYKNVAKTIMDNSNILTDECFEYVIDSDQLFIELVNNPRAEGQKIAQEFINSNGNFYIPGSSVKGALTTILNRDLEVDPLGINPKKARIKDKFVISDSEYLSADDFMILCTDQRPPAINLICLLGGVNFTLNIRKQGNLKIDELRTKLKKYSTEQIELALKNISGFRNGKDRINGADKLYEALELIKYTQLADQEYLVNIGFGGGSWFKIEKGKVPLFKSKSPNRARKGKLEPAHTSFMFSDENEVLQIGWCKLQIEEI
ncbi:MAG: type III-A CRISPR-associated RAMP protein Csm5 [Melioribacteraceae bacterium]|nr:type III-A CRISPR-associated RAMP protein Csm5 [Melioribacteraceae bacterium]